MATGPLFARFSFSLFSEVGKWSSGTISLLRRFYGFLCSLISRKREFSPVPQDLVLSSNEQKQIKKVMRTQKYFSKQEAERILFS